MHHHAFLTTALDGDQPSASCCGRLTPGRTHDGSGRFKEEKHPLLLPRIKLTLLEIFKESAGQSVSQFYCVSLYPLYKQPTLNTAGNRRQPYRSNPKCVSTHTGSIALCHRHWHSHPHTFLNLGDVKPPHCTPPTVSDLQAVKSVYYVVLLITNSTQNGSCTTISAAATQGLGLTSRGLTFCRRWVSPHLNACKFWVAVSFSETQQRL